MDSDTTIIGAGPYGLSIAAHLRAARVPFLLFGTPLESWRDFMPEGMVLKSEPFASNLWDPQRRFSLRRYFAHRRWPFQAVGAPLPLARFLEYADWFREAAALAMSDIRVIDARRSGSGFRLKLADGSELTSRRVVLATGHMAFRYVPSELQSVAEPLVLHSSRIGAVARYAGKQVLVIGAGQSALETAALLTEIGARVRIAVRRNALEWNAPPAAQRSLLRRIVRPHAGIGSGWRSMAVSELPRVFRSCVAPARRHRFVAGNYGPAGAWWLRSRVEDRIDVMLNRQVTGAEARNGGVSARLAGPEGPLELNVDHIVAATGFRVDIDRLEFLEESVRMSISREAPGIPSLTSRYETSVPGLYLVGVGSSPVFGPIMRFMYGAKHTAPQLAGHLRSTLGRRT